MRHCLLGHLYCSFGSRLITANAAARRCATENGTRQVVRVTLQANFLAKQQRIKGVYYYSSRIFAAALKHSKRAA